MRTTGMDHGSNTSYPLRPRRPRKRSRQQANTSDITALPRHVVYYSSNDEDEDASTFDINYPWFWQMVPSKQEVQLYSNLPLDIVRSIFDMAMWDRPQPSHLLLVSREVKSWVEPLLYRHVYICGLRRIGRFYRTFREWRMHGRNIDPSEGTQPSPLEVQTLTLGCYGRSELTSTVHAMLCELVNLYRLDFWPVGNYTPFIFSPYRPWGTMSSNDAYPFESLRHLSLDSQCLGSSITFKHRAFRDITHMDMYFGERTPWESLRHAQALTHLTLDMIYYRSPPFSTPELESWVTILVKACPPNVQIFVLGCIDKHNEDFDLLDFRRSDSGADDGRMPSSAVSRSKDYRRIHADNLHFLSRLALGKVDPRVVVGSATVLHKDHTFQNNVVYFTYREPPVGQWGSRCFGHVENCWYEAGRVIEGRIV